MSGVMCEIGRLAAAILTESVERRDSDSVERSLVAAIAVGQPQVVLGFLRSMLWEVIDAAAVAEAVAEEEKQGIGRLLSGEYKLGRRMMKSHVEEEIARVDVGGPAGSCVQEAIYWFVFAARAPRDVLKFVSNVSRVCENYVGARVELADAKHNSVAWAEEQAEQARLERDGGQISKEERNLVFARSAMRARQNLPVQNERWAAWSRIADAFVMGSESL